jgi:phenylpyruvate tautomerase PptA (4-oxalocrotonate tautomerase family)
MIDVFVPAGRVPAGRVPDLLQALANSVIRHEEVPARTPYLENTAAYLHEVPAGRVATAAGPDDGAVRVQILTPPGALSRQGQKGLVTEVTALLTDATGDPATASRTWVALVEAADGGWGVAGVALGRAEFVAARAAAAPRTAEV